MNRALTSYILDEIIEEVAKGVYSPVESFRMRGIRPLSMTPEQVRHFNSKVFICKICLWYVPTEELIDLVCEYCRRKKGLTN